MYHNQLNFILIFLYTSTKAMKKKILTYIKKNKTELLLLALILLIALFFRTYRLTEKMEFAHDADLYSWFVKDVVVDKHIRLIGQLTSADGIFIGPLFYYALIPFFLITNMDPVGGNWLMVILGIATTLSYYFVFTKLFNKKVGFIAMFLHAVLLTTINFDRAVVPSTPTNIWIIWFFYCVVQISRKKYTVLPLLGILAGLIWHIHIALAPAFLAVVAAILLNRKLPNPKNVFYFFIAFFITSIPLILFETRHGFSQITHFIDNFSKEHNAGNGEYKLRIVIDMIVKNTTNLFFIPQRFPQWFQYLFTISLLSSTILIIKKKIIEPKLVIVLFAWIVGMIIFFTLNSSPISEYYFANLEVIFIAIASLLLSLLWESKIAKPVLIAILAIILAYNTYSLLKWSDPIAGYIHRKAAVQFIAKDMQAKGYNCISLNYQTIIGENTGFRYFLWLNGVVLNPRKPELPNYTIVVPAGISDTTDYKFGLIGVAVPDEKFNKDEVNKNCSSEDKNLTDSMFGFVK